MALIFLIRKAPNQQADPSLLEAKGDRMKNLGRAISSLPPRSQRNRRESLSNRCKVRNVCASGFDWRGVGEIAGRRAVRTENYILAMKSLFSDDSAPISSSN
jgi:hypothetical protein